MHNHLMLFLNAKLIFLDFTSNLGRIKAPMRRDQHLLNWPRLIPIR